MGNLCFKDEAEKKAEKEKASEGKVSDKKKGGKGAKVHMSWDRPAPKLRATAAEKTFTASKDPADYAASNLSDGEWVRLPGQINDQRVNVDGCKNMTFLLVDQCDSVQVDDCENCRFFIGPTMSSVFIRNCTNCNFVVACGQLRTRDLNKCQFSLFCQSRPVLESSKNIKIACFNHSGYFQMGEHFAKAKLSVFNNLYFYVHDFTPKPGNFTVVAPDQLDVSFLPPISQHSSGYITKDEEDMLAEEMPTVPVCLGNLGHKKKLMTVILFKPGAVEAAYLLMDKVERMRREAEGTEPESLLLYTVEHLFTEESVASIKEVAPQFLTKAESLVGSPAVAMCLASNTVEGPTAVKKFSEQIGEDAFERDVIALMTGACGQRPGDASTASVVEKLANVMFLQLPLQGMGFGASH